ncbi:hypothetical protein [Antrihabitans sp. YC2-6]|uniref:hypothetical protein n=1 Tax=Antrihabitans sp. YC2-6 TaxID=2799498 RepID=UPI0018F68549|nr:hypothetical protein [Antrihabitans sp. YC2-6]MBJ8346493.1 hypothetical protein [Antrihabitans sp. YC2-6]
MPEAKVSSKKSRGLGPKQKRYGALLLAALLLIGLSVAATRLFWPNDKEDDVSEVQKQFCDFARSLITLDYNDWDGYFASISGKTSGEAKETVERNFGSQETRDAVTASQLRREVLSNDCGVKSESSDRVDFIAFLVAKSTNAEGTFVEQFAITGETKRAGDSWSITKVDLPILAPY